MCERQCKQSYHHSWAIISSVSSLGVELAAFRCYLENYWDFNYSLDYRNQFIWRNGHFGRWTLCCYPIETPTPPPLPQTPPFQAPPQKIHRSEEPEGQIVVVFVDLLLLEIVILGICLYISGVRELVCLSDYDWQSSFKSHMPHHQASLCDLDHSLLV